MDIANTVPRRVPRAVLRPALDVCKTTGVQLGDKSRVIVKLDQDGVGKALIKRLENLGVTVLVIEDSPSAEKLVSRIQGWLAEGPIHGVYWLAGLDSEGSWKTMDLPGFREAARVRVKLLYSTMRTLYDAIGERGTFLVSATRLGGKHGYDDTGALSPLAGAVCGFTKTFKREKPAALVKCVDFEQSRKTAGPAELLIDETLRDPGVVEVGYGDGSRWTVGLSIEPPPAEQEAFALGRETVFVVTGAAGSIVSAIVADLAAASGGVFYLLDLTPYPDAEDPDVIRFVSDKEGLKRDLFDRAKARGERATPKMVEQELGLIERQHSALAAIQAVEAAGGTAHYHRVDLLNANAVARAIDAVRERYGRVDVLLHAAGLEISHLLPKKQPREFDLVFDVKSDGWFNLLRSIGEMPLAATVAFSSIAGRFGNGGQTDYSAANDLLCKSGSSFRNARPGTRAVTIDWTAWGGIGMAARGSIPVMMERAGIDMLQPEAGIPVVRRELLGGTSGEIVVGQRLGLLLDEWDASGGLDPAALDSATPGPMATQVVGMGLNSGLTVETTLDPKQQPFLYDHQIDGTAVLPGVMGIEAFGELSKRLFPSWHVIAVEGVEFLAPFKFYRDEPRKVTVSANFRREGEEIVADCALTGSRQLPNQEEPQVKTHFTAQVRLSKTAPQEKPVSAPEMALDGAVKTADIYRVYFHGPAYQVLEGAWRAGEGAVGLMPADLPKNHDPEQLPTVMDPRLIELCFQTAGIHEIGTTGRMGLPLHLDSVRAVRDSASTDGRRLLAVVMPGSEAGSYDAAVVDDQGAVYVRLEGYRTVQMPNGIDPDQHKPIKAAMTAQ